MNRTRLLCVVFAAASALFATAGCEDEVQPPPPRPPGGAAPPPGQANQAGPQGNAKPDAGAPSPTANMPPLPPREFQEKDFSESEQSRDPFRNFASVFLSQAKVRTTVQRKSLVDKYALDELKLIGIVTRAPSRALFTDPTGLGWVASVGDFVGKSELVHAGGPTGIDVALNWRIDRIRPNDVVFIREDPSNQTIAPVTRVVSLRSADEEAGIIRPR